jgi:hypothetical protein
MIPLSLHVFYLAQFAIEVNVQKITSLQIPFSLLNLKQVSPTHAFYIWLNSFSDSEKSFHALDLSKWGCQNLLCIPTLCSKEALNLVANKVNFPLSLTIKSVNTLLNSNLHNFVAIQGNFASQDNDCCKSLSKSFSNMQPFLHFWLLTVRDS